MNRQFIRLTNEKIQKIFAAVCVQIVCAFAALCVSFLAFISFLDDPQPRLIINP